MKKVLVIHNQYREIGGEDIAVQNEVQFLKKYFEVDELYFKNIIENIFSQFIYFLINKNFKSIKVLENKINEFKPDVIYIHNTWFKASTAIITTSLKSKAKVFIKVHNFRYYCTRFYLSRNHLKGLEFCNGCGISKNETGLFNKYFSESFYKSLLVIRYGKKYFKILSDNNLMIFVLTKFHKNFMENLGISKNKISVYPNFIDTQNIKKKQQSQKYFLYAGRVSKEKGVKELVETFNSIENKYGYKLKIAGEGPYKENLERKSNSSSIEFVGALSNAEVLDLIKHAKAVITATKLFEGQPTILCEASSLETLSIYPSTGGISEFFPSNYEFSFEQFNYEDLKQKIEKLINLQDTENMGKNNKIFLSDYLNEENLIDLFKGYVSR